MQHMTEFYATDVANYSICGKTLQELLSMLEGHEQDVDKVQAAAMEVAKELARKGVMLQGSSGDKCDEAALIADMSRSLSEGMGVPVNSRRRKRLFEMVESAVEVLRREVQKGAVVDHDGMTRAEGGEQSLQMGDDQRDKAMKKTRTTRRRAKGGRAR